MELTLNPTLHCNFGCKYCFEANKPAKYMSDEVENALIDFVKKYNTVNKIHINWFGGEPLMAFDRIKSITARIKELETNFTASIITNGYLLSDEVIDNLESLHINRLQITLDGLAETHNQRRHLVSGKGTFDRILDNIDKLKNKCSDCKLVIRVNIDKDNQDEFIKVFRYFYGRYKNTVVVPGFVDDVSGCVVSDCFLNREKKANFLIDQYKKYGLNTMGFFPFNDRYECPVRNPYHLVIGPEGEIYKCWNDVGNPKQVVGSLLKNEAVNSTLLTRYYVSGDPFDDPKCVNCFHLPTCGGGCPHSRIAREYNQVEIDTCDTIKDNVKEFLELHYDYKQRISKQT
jgi:uncharacterized protein